MTDPMLRNNSWIIDRISIIAEYYLDAERVLAYTKVRKPRMHNIASEGWAPYIPCTPPTETPYIPTTAENDNTIEDPSL